MRIDKVIERTKVENNTYGIFANGTGSTGVIIVHIKDSVVANNAFNGISAYTAADNATVWSFDADQAPRHPAARRHAGVPTGAVRHQERVESLTWTMT